MNNAVSVLGCGWLGFPLARKFSEAGFVVKGSTTTKVKLEKMRKAGIEPFSFFCGPELVCHSEERSDEESQGLTHEILRYAQDDTVVEFFNSEILVLTLPFKRDFVDPEYYIKQVDSILKFVENSPLKKIIFTSSTSIYPDNIGVVNEATVFNPDNPRSEVLWEVEQMLLSNKRQSAVIVRLAGLYGDDRKIGKFLANQKSLPDAESPVNLIHRDDCVGIIFELVLRNVRGGVFNLCSDNHPSRRELYTAAAKKLGLNPPQFDSSKTSKIKIVDNQKIKDALGYQFLHPDPLTDL